MADTGEPLKRRIFEPIPESQPVEEPAPQVVPAEPVPA